MNTLILDTSTELELLIITTNGMTFDQSKNTGLVHSSVLFKQIDALLDLAKISIEDIECIACGIGPGSFTGVRIAVTTARMLAQLLKIPVIGIRTQQFYTQSPLFTAGDQVLVSFDAKKSRVFGALYEVDMPGSRPKIVVEEGDYPIEQLLEQSDTSKKLYSIGNGGQRYKDKITEARDKTDFVDESILSAELIEQFSQSEYKRLLGTLPEDSSYNMLLPHYARKSDAEVAKNMREQRD